MPRGRHSRSPSAHPTGVPTMFSRMIRRLSLTRNSRPPTSLTLECLEGREVPAIVYGLTAANTLLRFDSTVPTLVNTITITGLQTSTEHVVGIDFRPRTGQLVASTVPVGVAANALVRTYT